MIDHLASKHENRNKVRQRRKSKRFSGEETALGPVIEAVDIDGTGIHGFER
jgi:hypothetical protein